MYPSGDVCERCLRQIQRAIRSGRGLCATQAFATRRTQGTATGHNGAPRLCRSSSLLYSLQSLEYMETYRSGDVCERCLWQIQRAIRSGRGLCATQACATRRTQGTATGHNGAPRLCRSSSLLYSLRSLEYMETYRSGHNGADSKSVWDQSHVGSNPTVSAKE